MALKIIASGRAAIILSFIQEFVVCVLCHVMVFYLFDDSSSSIYIPCTILDRHRQIRNQQERDELLRKWGQVCSVFLVLLVVLTVFDAI